MDNLPPTHTHAFTHTRTRSYTRTHIDTHKVFRELGNFYRENGPNARLTEEVRESVLDKLRRIDESLG